MALTDRLGRVHAALPAWVARPQARPAMDFEHARRARRWPGALLLAAGVLACAAVGAQALALHQAVARLEALPAPPRANSLATRTTATATRLSAQQAEQAAAVVAQLSMPWGDWFEQLEASAKGKVVFTALQPQSGGQRVRVAGQARGFDDLVAYMTALDATPGFANVYLSEHAETAEGISFTLDADWVARP